MPQVKPEIETFAQIKVVGVGGSGGSAVDRMVKKGIRGVDFIVMNTDVQALHHNSAQKKIHIGKTITRGLGAGMDPEMGKRSAEEAQNEIRESLKDTDMVFITCGLGGGTGSGAGPVIAEIARDMGILTVGVVTKPFTFEGPQRTNIADGAYKELARNVDTIITIPNDRVLQIIDKKTSLIEAFKIVDDVLRQGVQGISELITVPGLVNVDFADVKTIMSNTGSALMGIGVGSGEDRAVDAAKSAISSPLLEVSIDGARGILFTITGGTELGMQEVAEAAKIITTSADENAKVIFGAVVDESMGEDIRITVIATDFEDRERKLKIMEEESQSSDSSYNKKPFYSSSLFTKKKSFGVNKNNDQEKKEVEKKVRPDPRPIKKDVREEEPVRVGFTSKPVSSSPFSSSSIKPASPPEPKPIHSTPVAPPVVEHEEEDDLEIPAFIRRKMGM
jgi:cell division protein FtsZ